MSIAHLAVIVLLLAWAEVALVSPGARISDLCTGSPSRQTSWFVWASLEIVQDRPCITSGILELAKW